MNRTYALVWNPSLAAWSVTDERARRRGKGAGAVLAAALLLPLTAIAADLPSGGQVVSGSGAINQPNASQMVIDQASNKLAIDWQSFDIAAGNKVTFNQPGRDAIALNRVLGADGSKIMGQLDANGRVFLINPNGVLFGAGAQVNVGGLVASTLNISDSDFEAGNYKFKGNASNASVTNNGQISAADGGSIALLGGTVSNNGVIVANQGTVALAAGNAVTLDFAGDGLLNVQVDEAVVDALVENHQLIKADGGQVLLTANAGDALLKTVVNNTGVIEAQTLGEKDGKIVLLGSFDGGTVQVAGTLDASAPNGGNGGFIETSGAHVKVADGAKVTTKAASGKTGTWLIDPTDFTVSAGNASKTDSGIGATTLSTTLNTTSVTLQTIDDGSQAGDINVNAAVTWNATTTLTLNAHNNININAAITASGAGGKVALKYGQATADGDGADYSIKAPINLQSGDNFSTQKGTSGPQITYTVVNDAAALQAMKDKRAGNYAVGSNIDLSSISNWVPVGDIGNFTGQFAGLGHTLSNLTIDRTDGDFVGLFGFTGFDSVIRDIGLVGGSVTGRYTVGGLIGFNRGTISNAYATGNVSGNEDVGGLVGQNNGTIGNAYATGNVLGNTYVGGLAGKNLLTISNAYATGSVSGNSSVGGLVGSSESGTISNTYATGSVSGNSSVGGLVGFNYLGTINSSFYATTDAAGSVINNSGATTGAFSGNNLGTGKIWAQLSASATFAAWNQSIWSFPGTGASVSGYGLGGLPYLTGVTRQADIVRSTLFAGGFGTQDSAYTITSWQQLANISQVLSGGYYFSLSNNLDQNSLGYTTLASATANGGAGWNPLGNNNNPFTGTFNGLSHTISDLIINRSGTNYVGLFGYAGRDSVIRDIGLVGGSVSGFAGVGGLVGYNYGGNISNAYATGNVTGSGNVGGLVGINGENSTISNAYATGSVSASGGNGGGLVGYNAGGNISSSFYATTDENGNPINNEGATGGAFTDNSNGTGKTWAELTLASTFKDWDIATTGGSNAIWRIYDGHSGPLLRSFLQSVTLTADASGGSKTYDSTAVTGTTTYTSSSLGSDLDTGKILGSSLGYASNSKNAGTYSSTDGSLILSGLYSGQQGYDISYADTSLTISKADLAVTGIRASDKTYNATTAANLSYDDASFNGRFGTDALTVASASGAFTDKNAGTGKTVNITDIVLGGADAANYTLTSNTATTTADISKADLAVTDINANNKTYDATTAATLSGSAVVTAISGDTVSLSGMGVGSFADANAGVNKAVTVSGYSLSGTDANNYNLLQPSGVTATINKADLTLSGSKVYDGNTSVAGSTLTATGVAGETFAVAGSGDASNLASKNVQSGSTLSSLSGLTLGTSSNGGLNSNYNVLSTSGSSYTVTAKGITLTGISALDKTYDATTTAALNTANVGYSGLVSGDTVTLAGNGTGSFANKNAGANKAVTVSGYSLSGTDAGNYVVTQPTGLTASISKADLAVTGISALNKTYDATTAATLSGSAAVTALGSDIVSVSDTGVGTFADKNAGANKAVTASGYTLSGTDAGNYNIVQPTGLTADINKAALTITANNASKTYNGLAFSGGNGVSYNGFVNGENAGVLGGALTYGGSAQGAVNAGTYGLSASGLTSDNYTVSYNAGSLNVAKAQATVTANSGQVTYNGQQQSITGFTASGLVNGETTSVLSGVSTSGGNGSNAGSYIHSATGTDGNYDLSFIDGALTIDKAALTITALDANKIAGQSIALTGYSASGLLGDDSISSVSLSSLGQPTTAAAGNYAIVASDAVGEALSNYAISYREGTLQVTDNTANSQPYIGAIVANSQTAAAPESTSPVSEPEAQNLQMLMTNPLAEVINLQVINQGIRLPEGI